uniref:Uncharacterized protein n=1 Tax=Magallana gigas TaxID=29159 RepID=A0A8W8M8N4_MAGGI
MGIEVLVTFLENLKIASSTRKRREGQIDTVTGRELVARCCGECFEKRCVPNFLLERGGKDYMYSHNLRNFQCDHRHRLDCFKLKSEDASSNRKRKKESRKTEEVTYVKGQIVYCYWKGIWWPGAVESVLKNDVYQISFWKEEERKNKEAG